MHPSNVEPKCEVGLTIDHANLASSFISPLYKVKFVIFKMTPVTFERSGIESLIREVSLLLNFHKAIWSCHVF